MKKFLAVLLAVALLGVAGAAFAADASHVVPTDSTTGDPEKQVVVDETKLAEVATKYVASKDVVSTITGSGVTVSKDAAAASVDKAIKDHAAKQEVVVAVLPTLTVTEATAMATAEVKFDATYNGTTPKAEVASTDVMSPALAGGDFKATFSKVTEGKATLTLENVPAKKALDIVAYLASDDVASLTAFAGAFATYETGAENGLHTYVEPAMLTKINAVVTVDKLLDKKDLGAAITTSSLMSKDAVVGLAELKNLSTDAVYAFKYTSFDVLNGKLTASADKKTLALDLDGKTSGYVSVAAKATAYFFDETGANVTGSTIPEKTGYVAFKATGATATPVLTVDKSTTPTPAPSTDPTSNKGSGGCNGGFAGIAVLALGLAALRRKAR